MFQHFRLDLGHFLGDLQPRDQPVVRGVRIFRIILRWPAVDIEHFLERCDATLQVCDSAVMFLFHRHEAALVPKLAI